MKKAIAVIIVLCSIVSVSIADTYFGDFTYEQLLILHHALDQEIMSRPEWKEVTVPTGDWIVGIDIPEGQYSIRPVKSAYVNVKDSKGSLLLNEGLVDDEIVGKIDLKTGYTVHVSGDVIFTHAKGLDF